MRSSLVAIAALALFGLFNQSFATNAAGKAQFVSARSFPKVNDNVGGLSGLSVDETGTEFLALSDRGTLVSGRLKRKDGTIQKILVRETTRLKDPDGRTISKQRNDSEGLAIRSDGRIYMSFEGPARVWTYRDPKSEAAWLPRHPSFKKMKNNGSLEALAIDTKGALFTLAEGTNRGTEPHRIYRYDANGWKLFDTISKTPRFLPVGADFGPDGKFYLLERSFSVLAGLQSQVRRFDVSESGFSEGEVLLEGSTAQHGNLEGLSVWLDSDGKIRLTMISDDNFKFFMSGEIVEYVVTE